MIDVFKHILFWPANDFHSLVQIDLYSFLVGGGLVLSSLIYLYNKGNIKKSTTSKLRKIAISIQLLGFILSRGEFMYREVQGESWSANDAIIVLYTILYSMIRVGLYIFFLFVITHLLYLIFNKMLQSSKTQVNQSLED